MNQQTTIAEILEYNKSFVQADGGKEYTADRKPKKQLAIVTCMDSRLITLLNEALGLKNGDANIIKLAGAEVIEAYGAVMRSLLVAIHMLDVRDVMVIAHTECGVQDMNAQKVSDLMRQSGINDEAFEAVKQGGIDLAAFMEGFGDMEDSVRSSVATIREHPLIPPHVNVYGFVIEVQTGRLIPVE